MYYNSLVYTDYLLAKVLGALFVHGGDVQIWITLILLCSIMTRGFNFKALQVERPKRKTRLPPRIDMESDKALSRT